MKSAGNNALFSYELRGDENLPVLLMLHGFIGSSQKWSNCIQNVQADCRCLVIDMPGHGKSIDLPDEAWYTFDMTTQLILNLLKKLHINKYSILGYSMGGRIALNLVLRNPQYFNKAVIESATPGLKSDKERSDRLYADIKCSELLRTENISQFLDTWYNQPLFQTIQKHPNYHYMLERRKQNDPEELAKALCGLSVGLQTQL